MLSRTYSVAFFGIDLLQTDVEVNIFDKGFPGFDIIGLPGKEISESKERIASALKNAGMSISGKKILVNLAPADIPKDGSSYDMPISAGIISCLLNRTFNEKVLMFGELSLDGSFVYTKRSFLALIFALQSNYEKVFVPMSNSETFKIPTEASVYGFSHISELISYIDIGSLPKLQTMYSAKHNENIQQIAHLSEIIGQESAKRALIVSAAGKHNIHFEGPPGSGKSMLSRTYPSLLPDLDHDETLEVTKIHSIAGCLTKEQDLINTAPFRSPHHTISYAGMLGGSSVPRPGEVSLAHRGILFLDEFSEFSRQVIESLRQPLEDGISVIVRSKGSFIFPARFTLVAASNPCPCGYFTHPQKSCTCTPQQIQRYKSKLSGPILDRIDMFIQVQPVDIEKLVLRKSLKNTLNEDVHVKEKIFCAIEIQKERFLKSNTKANSQMSRVEIEKYCKLESAANLIMKKAAKQLNISARGYFKILKVARTIADIDNSDDIKTSHVAESLQYRR